MDILQENKELNKKSFLSHVFSTTEEGKAEILNVVQYAIMGVLPIVALNKTIQRFIPEADTDKTTLELLVEIFIQIIVMFCGIVVIHRAITYIPTYSGFKYESLTLTNVILAFLVIVLSIHTKLGIKVNILFDRAMEAWNGPSQDAKANIKKNVRFSQPISQHNTSQADYLDNSHTQSGIFPPAPIATSKQSNGPMGGMGGMYDNLMGGVHAMNDSGPAPANGLLGGSFGSLF